LVFGLVAAASWFARDVVGSALPSVAVAVFMVPTFVAAFVIGLRFRSWSWLAGPTVVFTLQMVGLALTADPAPETGVSPVISSREELVRLFAFAGLLFGFFVFGIPALLGVWWGTRREAANVRSTRSSLGADAST
jgi:hypothetical protein